MGCSPTNIFIKESHTKIKLNSEKRDYHIRQEIFFSHYSEILPKLSIFLEDYDDYTAAKLKEAIIDMKGSQLELDLPNLTKCVQEFAANVYLEENNLIKDYNIFEYAIKFLEVTIGNSEVISLSEILLNNFIRIFPKMQKGFYFNLSNIEELPKDIKSAILTNLKFNISFNLELLTVHADRPLLLDANLCEGISGIIESNSKLKSLIIRIDNSEFTTLTNEMKKRILLWIKSASKHYSLKFLLIMFDHELESNLGLDIEKTILDIVKNDYLNCLSLIKFSFSDEFMVILSKSISYSKNLKVFLFESKTLNTNLLDDLIIQGLGRNRSIQIFIFGGFVVDSKKVLEYKQIKENNDVIQLFEYYN